MTICCSIENLFCIAIASYEAHYVEESQIDNKCIFEPWLKMLVICNCQYNTHAITNHPSTTAIMDPAESGNLPCYGKVLARS